MVVFEANLCVDFILTACPPSGFEALDWRRANGFRDRLDNTYRVELTGRTTEAAARRLVAAGWVMRVDAEGNGLIEQSSLPDEFDPERGSIPISIESMSGTTEVGMLCFAHAYRAQEAARAALDAK